MSANKPQRRHDKNRPAAHKGRKNKGGGAKRKKKRGANKANQSAIDPKRPVWENRTGEAELRAIVGSVRPAQNPIAVVRSLGEPPLGKYASNAHHYYEAVYEKAQQYAVAIAAANGLLVVDETEERSGSS